MRKLGLLIVSIVIVFQFACEENTKRVEKKDKKAVEKAEAPIEEHKQKAFYPIPSPEQMLGFINDNGVRYNRDLINSSAKAATYMEPTKMALNFGVYIADLAYTAAYQDINSTITLYKTVKKMGAEMQIAEMMTEEMMSQVQSNMENPDSLMLVAGEAYYQAVEFLEKNNQEGKLALMSLGGWIESLYITTSAIEDFEASSKTAERLASQKITFGNLYAYLQKHEEENGVKQVLQDIQEVRSVFASLEETRSAKTEKSDEGKLIFGKGKKVIMTEVQFNQLKKVLEKYRNQLTD